MLRLGKTTSLNAFDLTALRLGAGGLILLVGGFGAPYILLVSLALKTAPASAAGSFDLRRARIPALHATAIVAWCSAILYLPLYLIGLPKAVFTAPLIEVLIQAAYQGVLVSVVALDAFNRPAELLGPLAGATLPALIPLVTLALSALVLGESVSTADLVSAIAIASKSISDRPLGAGLPTTSNKYVQDVKSRMRAQSLSIDGIIESRVCEQAAKAHGLEATDIRGNPTTMNRSGS